MLAEGDVEADMLVGRVVGRERGAAHQQDLVAVGILHQQVHVQPFGHAAPQENACVAGLLEQHASRAQLPRAGVARHHDLALQPLQVLAQVAGLEHFQQHVFVQRRQGHDGMDLGTHQQLEQGRRRGQVAHAQGRAQRLAQAGVIDHAVQSGQRRQPRAVARLEMAVHVVFGDQEAMLLRHDQHLVQVGGAAAPPGGIVQSRLHEQQARTVRAAGRFQFVQVEAIGAALDRHQAHAVLAQPAEHQEVSGVFHQHRIAGLQKRAADQIDGMGAAESGEDVAGVRGDADAAQQQRDLLAQFGQPLRRTARSHAGRAARQATLHGGRRQRILQPRGRQGAAAGQQHARPLVVHLLAQPDRFLLLARFQRHLVGNGAAGVSGGADEEARRAVRIDDACGHQPVIRHHHGVGAHRKLRGELADRRQPGPARQDALRDLLAQCGLDLLEQGDGRGAVDGEHGWQSSVKTSRRGPAGWRPSSN